ncbi:filamentous hemagglutinin N-terminal domain-containing protein [Agrobacterium salinitolerans]|uniref:Filamentous hemagglutinin N-terminal domain-containing protein n=2 Tax=Agrobacterium salinitolerans TaxID=1183413 RepID=A0A9X3KPT2_9HYPH|nr:MULTISPECIES: filamentous hemagglutinin N-terminal domain-containing protein [Agrobacterium]MCZ7854113.1 filamentous hemagglutinin N-terminal domain-containing protein [Agrobacterium salinitolerans]MCZ7892659.1 filamentous hemagglutinin N-terminal domain-containing protein [Agrobacterium salinitolerans]MCZ7937516.1 filamentous hemagglutinin N-terminal domain-containing protein [Agrobacterium salinitolerans]MCZ7976033.1 filamentous hemagglutinin N-terminal domain-containing protein [Agrobacte
MRRTFKLANMKHSLAASLSLLLCGVAQPAVAQVIPDGGSNTRTSADVVTGATTVHIADPVGSPGSTISHNTYTEFSVSPLGVNLDNSTVHARTILNEVTSSRISNLNGPLRVVGDPAHVIIANPNGISVNGASFHNTGGVVLSTGKASIVSRQITPTSYQDNIVLKTADGAINVGPGGLSGAMSTLQMLAGRIRIDGPVENSSPQLRSSIELTAGGSSVEYDSAIVPNSDLENWGRMTDEGSNDNSLAIEITSRGTLKANTVRIRATSNGAGVSHAGNGLAAFGDFVIDASGKVTTSGSIEAKRNVHINAGSIEARSLASQPQSRIEAINGALTLLAGTGDITNTGVLMSGKSQAFVKAAGDVKLLTENTDQLAIVFGSEGRLDVQAEGSVINNTGRLLSNSETTIDAGKDILNIADILNVEGVWHYQKDDGKRLWYTAWQSRETTETISINYGQPRLPGRQAYIIGSSVSVKAGDNIVNRGSSINADSGSVYIEGSSILNEGGLSGSLQFVKRCRLTCIGYGSSTTGVAGGAINANGNIELRASSSILNRYGQIVSYGSINATAPSVVLEGGSIPTVVQRPTGLYNFWGGSTAWIGTGDQGGVFDAPQGSITINAFRPVQVTAGALRARDGVFASSGIETFKETAGEEYPFGLDSIGLFPGMVGR